MRKILATALVLSLVGFGLVSADYQEQGEGLKEVPVCAYFINTADFLDELSFYYHEVDADGIELDIVEITGGECMRPQMKESSYGFYVVTKDYASTLDLEKFDPTEDENAYSPKYPLESGFIDVEEDSNISIIYNAYSISNLDLEEGVLITEPVSTTINYNDESEPEVKEGEVQRVFKIDSEDEDVDVEEEEEETEEDKNDEEVEEVFKDITEKSVYYDALKYLKEEGIIEGYADGTYKPNALINRAEFTKIIVGSISSEEDLNSCKERYVVKGDSKIRLFFDVFFDSDAEEEPIWYFKFLCQGKKLNIIEGYSDGNFLPDQNINFAEASKIITKGFNGDKATAGDPWYKNYVTILEENNAIPTTISSFDKEITRGEMAEIIYRLKAEVDDKESLTYGGIK